MARLGSLVIASLLGCGSSSPSAPDTAVVRPGADAAPMPDAAAPMPDAAAPMPDAAALMHTGDVAAPDGPALADATLAGGLFTVSWQLEYVQSAATVTCALAGTPTVILSISPAGGGSPIEVSADCDRMDLATPPLAPGSYAVTIELRDAGDRVVSVQSGSFEARPSSVTDLGEVIFEVQSFQLAWSLSRGGQPLTCQAAGATTVALTTRLNTDPVVTYMFPCTDGVGASPAILLGTYNVAVELLGTGGTVLWQTDPMTVPVADDQRAVLPPVVFDLQ